MRPCFAGIPSGVPMIGKLLFRITPLSFNTTPISISWFLRRSLFLITAAAAFLAYALYFHDFADRNQSLVEAMTTSSAPNDPWVGFFIFFAPLGVVVMALRNFLVIRSSGMHNIPWERSFATVFANGICAVLCIFAAMQFTSYGYLSAIIGLSSVWFVYQAFDDYGFVRVNQAVELGMVTANY